MLFKLSNLNSNLALTLGYLNPALNNSAQGVTVMNISLTSLIRLRCQDRWVKKVLLTSVVQHVLFLYFDLVLLTRHQLSRRKYRLRHLLF